MSRKYTQAEIDTFKSEYNALLLSLNNAEKALKDNKDAHSGEDVYEAPDALKTALETAKDKLQEKKTEMGPAFKLFKFNADGNTIEAGPEPDKEYDDAGNPVPVLDPAASSVGGPGTASVVVDPNVIPELDETTLKDYKDMWDRLKILDKQSYDSSYIFFLKPKNGASNKTSEWSCFDIKELLRGVTIESIKKFYEKIGIPENIEKISFFRLLFNMPKDDSPLNVEEADGKTYLNTNALASADRLLGGSKRRRSSKKTSLKTRSENNLRWLIHIGLRSLQQINSGKKPVSRKSSTKKPAVATKDDLLKVAKKLKLSGLSNKTKKDIAAAIRKVDVKKLNESQKKTLEKFKNMKM